MLYCLGAMNFIIRISTYLFNPDPEKRQSFNPFFGADEKDGQSQGEKKKIEKEICIKTSVCLFQLYPFEVTVLLKKESIFCIRAMIKVVFVLGV